MIKEYSFEQRDNFVIEELFNVWKKSVEATHNFLNEKDIESISKFVPEALRGITTLLVMEVENKKVGFMGIANQKIEMLFLEPESIGKGFGKKLVRYAKEKFSVTEVSVNEQNPKALEFYKKMGFVVYNRNEFDEMGNNFPILDMKIEKLL